VVASVVIQIASTALWYPLEINQMLTLGHPTFAIALRFKNIAALALGKVQAWGLSNSWTWDDPWIRLRSTTPWFLPCLLAKNPDVPRWLAHTLSIAWFGLLAGLLAVLALLRRLMSSEDYESAHAASGSV
jgi:ABC-type phosphate/phosphonate transport system permease subunit